MHVRLKKEARFNFKSPLAFERALTQPGKASKETTQLWRQGNSVLLWKKQHIQTFKKYKSLNKNKINKSLSLFDYKAWAAWEVSVWVKSSAVALQVSTWVAVRATAPQVPAWVAAWVTALQVSAHLARLLKALKSRKICFNISTQTQVDLQGHRQSHMLRSCRQRLHAQTGWLRTSLWASVSFWMR